MKVYDILRREKQDYCERLSQYKKAYRGNCRRISFKSPELRMDYLYSVVRKEIEPELRKDYWQDTTPEFRGKLASTGMAFLKEHLLDVGEESRDNNATLPVVLGIKLLSISGNLGTSLSVSETVEKILKTYDISKKEYIVKQLDFNLKTAPSLHLVIDEVIPRKKEI